MSGSWTLLATALAGRRRTGDDDAQVRQVIDEQLEVQADLGDALRLVDEEQFIPLHQPAQPPQIAAGEHVGIAQFVRVNGQAAVGEIIQHPAHQGRFAAPVAAP